MMMSEFIERTGYEPTYDEYHYIEESYYEFPGNKDEFCKQWMKDNKDGHWKRELNLMKAMDEMKAKYEEKIAEKEETIAFYRPYFEKAWKTEKKATILELTSEETVDVQIRGKDGRTETFENVKVIYISKDYNKIFDFINIIPKSEWSGWTRSIRLDDIEMIRRI